LFVAIVGGGCGGAAFAQQDSTRAPDGGGPQRDPIAASVALEPYPLVELRKDLGEAEVEGERDLVRHAIESVESVITLRAEDKNNIGRGDHAKALGCHPAEFTVSGAEVVRPEDQAGIAMPENLGKTFPAIVRLSNSEPKDVSDFRSATVGLAVKIVLDPAQPAKDQFLFERSGAQDFVAGGLDVFVSRSISEYADLFRRRIHPFANALQIMDRHPEAYWVFGKEPLLRLVNPSPGAAPIVLDKTFSSLVPYAWGNGAVKFRFEPCRKYDRSTASFSRFDSDYQSKVVTRFLEANDICYVMMIQTRPRPGSDDERIVIDRTYPLDDAMARWPEPGDGETTPGARFHEVARVTIKRGTKAMDEQACECLAFNPWHGLKAHQPLGSLNRARAAVYKKSELVRKDIYRPRCPEQQ
jgi:hypothetical protein